MIKLGINTLKELIAKEKEEKEELARLETSAKALFKVSDFFYSLILDLAVFVDLPASF